MLSRRSCDSNLLNATCSEIKSAISPALTVEPEESRMRLLAWKWTPAIFLIAALAIPAGSVAQEKPDHQPTIITIDVPGAGTGAIQGTIPYAINPRGEVTGAYYDANNILHGFVWKCDRGRSGQDGKECKGSSTTFDPPDSLLTIAYSINPEGEIAGEYYDGNYRAHGFLRASDGTITTFLGPILTNTYGTSINAEGEITGDYSDNQVAGIMGFLRARDGTITTFNPPGSVYTFPNSINARGEIAGDYLDVKSEFHGFLRTRNGNFATFEAPGAGTGAYQGTLAGAINSEGVIVGNYHDAIGLSHGFVRNPDGAITTFDAPGAVNGTSPGLPQSINPEGTIVGTFSDANNIVHGFLRSRDGHFTTIDAPGAGASANQGTAAISINPEGLITGYYIDASNVVHGFVREANRDGRFRPQ